jgi:secretion/DNA translocation related TadE-like protein
VRTRRAGRRSRAGGDQRGAAALMAVTLSVVLLLCTTVGVAAGRWLSDQRRAAAAADLAALAGAAAVQRGLDGCAQAHRIANANGAVLTGCTVRGQVVQLAVRTDSARFLGRLVRPSAEARAGPVR